MLAGGCTALENPRTLALEAVEAWAESERVLPLADDSELQLPAGRLRISGLQAWRKEGGRIEAFGKVSAEGRAAGRPFSYLGNERLELRCRRDCELQEAPIARMREVLGALVARQDALRAGDRDALNGLAESPEPLDAEAVEAAAQRGVAAWFIRVEGDEAIVGEADEEGQQRRLLLRRGEEGWRFRTGLL